MYEDIIARAVKDEKFLARFWAKISKSNGCWEWTGSHDRHGYGSIGLPRTRVNAKATRVSWTVERGQIPIGMCVCHKCDNPRCVRVTHLFLSTHEGNMRDMAEKGRGGAPRGELAWHTKLTEQQVRALRARAANGESRADLARAFGISWDSTDKIVRRHAWAHIE